MSAQEVMHVTHSIRPYQAEAITNIGQLFEALAVDWQERGYKRALIAAHHGMKVIQFVRIKENRYSRPTQEKQRGDIPVESPGYSMSGFIQFETKIMFRGLFHTYENKDPKWKLASLTKLGFEIAQSSVLDFELTHPDIKRCEFFNPKLKQAALELPNHQRNIERLKHDN